MTARTPARWNVAINGVKDGKLAVQCRPANPLSQEPIIDVSYRSSKVTASTDKAALRTFLFDWINLPTSQVDKASVIKQTDVFFDTTVLPVNPFLRDSILRLFLNPDLDDRGGIEIGQTFRLKRAHLIKFHADLEPKLTIQHLLLHYRFDSKKPDASQVHALLSKEASGCTPLEQRARVGLCILAEAGAAVLDEGKDPAAAVSTVLESYKLDLIENLTTVAITFEVKELISGRSVTLNVQTYNQETRLGQLSLFANSLTTTWAALHSAHQELTDRYLPGQRYPRVDVLEHLEGIEKELSSHTPDLVLQRPHGRYTRDDLKLRRTLSSAYREPPWARERIPPIEWRRMPFADYETIYEERREGFEGGQLRSCILGLPLSLSDHGLGRYSEDHLWKSSLISVSAEGVPQYKLSLLNMTAPVTEAEQCLAFRGTRTAASLIFAFLADVFEIFGELDPLSPDARLAFADRLISDPVVRYAFHALSRILVANWDGGHGEFPCYSPKGRLILALDSWCRSMQMEKFSQEFWSLRYSLPNGSESIPFPSTLAHDVIVEAERRQLTGPYASSLPRGQGVKDDAWNGDEQQAADIIVHILPFVKSHMRDRVNADLLLNSQGLFEMCALKETGLQKMMLETRRWTTNLSHDRKHDRNRAESQTPVDLGRSTQLQILLYFEAIFAFLSSLMPDDTVEAVAFKSLATFEIMFSPDLGLPLTIGDIGSLYSKGPTSIELCRRRHWEPHTLGFEKLVSKVVSLPLDRPEKWIGLFSWDNYERSRSNVYLGASATNLLFIHTPLSHESAEQLRRLLRDYITMGNGLPAQDALRPNNKARVDLYVHHMHDDVLSRKMRDLSEPLLPDRSIDEAFCQEISRSRIAAGLAPLAHISNDVEASEAPSVDVAAAQDDWTLHDDMEDTADLLELLSFSDEISGEDEAKDERSADLSSDEMEVDLPPVQPTTGRRRPLASSPHNSLPIIDPESGSLPVAKKVKLGLS